ncbi:DUF4349 domain-containing protein [Bacillus carboniphilus]|uniref:DUF4349 domain-containing protein n=1 Tax=Bacillus carboniphilus TaxID=86663 RepID=A0ABY9JV42_9BACI|nr:DUF4349 domain-containing protein [Bacillus carboniphilus]WLR43271.1 DUF4349 domain-containing protein [Bacillus carboniphilus]
MKIILKLFIGLSILMVFVGCSNDQSEVSDEAPYTTEESHSKVVEHKDEQLTNDQELAENNETVSEKKIIYNAFLDVEMKDYEQTIQELKTEATNLGGYVLNVNTIENDNERRKEGNVTFRIPEGEFQSFLEIVKGKSVKVNHQSESATDVTEEYVDLESRLKSKQAVEKRLNDYLQEAENVEDLLSISKELERVQQEIEQLKGRIQYLENQTSYATVDLRAVETKANIPGQDDLNTWERTKQTFLESMNKLLAFASNVVVFLVGYLPIIILITVIGIGGVWISKWWIKKSKSRQKMD